LLQRKYAEPEENVEIPLIDVGEKHQLRGIVLTRYEMAYIADGAVVRLFFANGTCILHKSIDDYQTYEVVNAVITYES